VHKPSTKEAQGVAQFVVTIPWDDNKMYAKAKLAMYVPPIAKVISTTLSQKPRDGSLSVTLHLPSSVGTDSFQLGAVSITSGPKQVPPPPPPPTNPHPPPAMAVAVAMPMHSVQSTISHANAVASVAAMVTARQSAVAAAVASPRQPAKKQKTDAKKKAAVVTAPPTKEATIEQALAGIFSGFQYLQSAPTWLDKALTEDATPLLGLHILYNWEEWGWAPGKLSGTTKSDCNFAVTYEGDWVEHQSLMLSAYGQVGHGSWMLLEATRSPSPILEYKSGKYLVQRSSGNVWLRASELLHHPDKDLATARTNAAAAKRRQSHAAAESEIDTSGFAVGDNVYAQGLAPTGSTAFFAAQVLAIRERFPPIQVKYTETLSGDEDPLLLPIPSTAFVPAMHVQRERPQVAASGKRARSKESYAE
jgi:hypothetical protein